MFKNLIKLVGLVMGTLAWDQIPIVEGKMKELSDNERKDLQDALGEIPVDQAVAAINKSIDAHQKLEAAQEVKRKDALTELEALLDQTGIGIQEKEKILDKNNPNLSAEDALKNVSAELKSHFGNLEKRIKTLGDEPEADSPEDIINGTAIAKKIKHSGSHFLGTNKEYDAFSGRNWNKRAAGISAATTDFSDKVQVAKLQGDLELYYRENPDKLNDLNRDNFGLPTFWPKRLNVDDRVSDGFIATAEITQARKLPWLPKNKQKITAEEGRIFPVQIDAEFIGFNLQKMESSWLNKWNKEGSQAYKVSFVGYLVQFLDKQARVEDRKSSIGGIYVETPEEATVPGRMINRQDGLKYQIWKAINVTRKLKAFSVGSPTTANIVDYVDDIIKRLPDDIRETANLKFYMSRDWIRAYKRRYEQIHGTYSDYDGYPENPKDFENIDFVPLYDLSGTDIMFITFPDNIEILENIPSEKGKYNFEMIKRIMYVFADYKLGIRLIHIGTTVLDTDPEAFKVQTVWANNVPLFKSDFFIPVFDDATGLVTAKYSNIEVQKDWVTEITKINATYEGQVIKIKGNESLASAVNVKDNANLDLTADFDLKSGGTLTLIAQAGGGLKEVKRTTEPATAPSGEVEFSGTTFDATSGNDFSYTGAAATLASITYGVENQVITIVNNGSGNLTINDVATIDVASTAIVKPEDSIEFVRIDGVWTEKSRAIA